MKILFITGRETSYPRNRVMLNALQQVGDVDVILEKFQGNLLQRLAFGLPALLYKRIRGDYDLVFVGFYGHIFMVAARLLARKPILFDAFVSTYDTLCFDRGTFKPGSLPGRLAYWLDRYTCSAADLVLLDTPEHAAYFAETFHLPIEKIKAIPVGCNEDLFRPQTMENQHPGIKVLHYSTYLPIHGVDVVIRAAALLKDQSDIHFTLVGAGPEKPRVEEQTRLAGLGNVEFKEYLPLKELVREITEADICLGGHFGASAKAARVVPGKIYQFIAMAKATIAGDTPANRRLLEAERNTLFVPTGNGEKLAEAILRLANDEPLRRQLEIEGRITFEQKASEAVIRAEIRKLALNLVADRP